MMIPTPRVAVFVPLGAPPPLPGVARPTPPPPSAPADPSLPLAQPGDAVAVLPRGRRWAGARRAAPHARRPEGRARRSLQVRGDPGPTRPAPARRGAALARERRHGLAVLVRERVRRARPRAVVRARARGPLPRGAARPAGRVAWRRRGQRCTNFSSVAPLEILLTAAETLPYRRPAIARET